MRRCHLRPSATGGLLLLWSCFACSTGPEPIIVPGAAHPALSYEEHQERVREVESLIESGQEEEATAAIRDYLKGPTPAPIRRRLQALRRDAQESRFYRLHPLHLTLEVEPPSAAFGDTVRVMLRVSNLGREKLMLPARHRTLWEAVRLRDGERSVLFLEVESRDEDGMGSSWGQRRMVDVPITDDLVIAAGASERLVAELPIQPDPRALHRLLKVSAVYRPIVVATEGGERRYDPLEFPSVTIPVIDAGHARWYRGGLNLLKTCVDGEAIGRPETLFVAAMGLPKEALHEGVDLLVRAAPSLDPTRGRAALAAFSALTGFSAADDPTRALDWWLAEGSAISDDDLWRRAGREVEPLRGGLRTGELSIEP